MSKDKKKKSKKDDSTGDVFETAALSIRKFRKVTREIGRLSTGQKLVGGLALVAGGLAYLALRPSEESDEPATGAWQLPASKTENPAGHADEEESTTPTRKNRKNMRSHSSGL